MGCVRATGVSRDAAMLGVLSPALAVSHEGRARAAGCSGAARREPGARRASASAWVARRVEEMQARPCVARCTARAPVLAHDGP